MKNPFTIKVITKKAEFCNRADEIKQLVRFAENDTNVVLYSPRRYGKTSLMHLVQEQLKARDFITVFIDLFGLSSVDNIADRLARGIYTGLQPHKSLLNKAVDLIRTHKPMLSLAENSFGNLSVEKASQKLFGEDLLNATLEGVGRFLEKTRKPINIVLDEFQEIVRLKNSNIEGILRSHIQVHSASYFFVGSRRRVLLEMFKLKRRPFFNSAFEFTLPALPHEELVQFICRRFAAGKKDCPVALAEKIADMVSDHPYYTQKLCHLIFNDTAKKVTKVNAKNGIKALLEGERNFFEQCLLDLAPQQIALLRAIAKEPAASLMSTKYIRRHNLSSIGAIQGATQKLLILDHIEKNKDGVYFVVDPFFKIWLNLN